MDKLLISTMLSFLYCDGDTYHVLHEGKLEDGGAHYHGITWDNKGTLYLSGAEKFHYVLHRFHVPGMVELPLLEGDLHETHQMIWIKGLLYVTNTGKNRVDVWDGRRWATKAWNPSPCDIEHVNAIWCDGTYVYVGEHGQKTLRGSIARKCEMGTLEQVDEIHIGPNIHNVYVENGYMYNITSSADANQCGILCTNVDTGDTELIPLPQCKEMLLRGLARTEQGWYIGVSKWEVWRDSRHQGDSVVIRLNEDFEEVDRIVFPNHGPVCSVRVVGAQDKAHNGIILERI